MTNTNKSPYIAALTVVLFLLILFFLFGKQWLLYASFAIGFLSLLSEKIASIIDVIWGRVMRIVGTINAYLILTLVFFLVLFPIAILYRLFTKDAMNLKANKDSYFIVRDHKYEAKDLENVW